MQSSFAFSVTFSVSFQEVKDVLPKEDNIYFSNNPFLKEDHKVVF